MSDTTWDTDECERWIDNEYNLYDLVLAYGKWMTHDELTSFLASDIDWRYLNGDIDPDEVNYGYLATQYLAVPTGPGPFDT